MADQAEAERRLWMAVLQAGLDDLARGIETNWPNTRDFETVASLAGFDPEAVRDALRRKAAMKEAAE